MHIDVSPCNKYVVFQTTDIKEIAILKKFPGLLYSKSGGFFYIPNKLNVIHNIFGRLKSKFKKTVTISEKVHLLRQEKEVLLDIPPEFTFHTEPLEHQLLALRHLYTRKNLGLLLDPGLGKTKTVLDYIYLSKLTDKNFTKALIVCPKALLFVWQMETARHRPELRIHVINSVSYRSLIASREAKMADLSVGLREAQALERDIARLRTAMEEENKAISNADVIVVNYAKVVDGEAFFTKNKWSLLAIDEGLVKNPRSQQTEVITKISRNTDRNIVMSGTLINNGPEDVFAPVRILEPALLGTSFYTFNDYYGIMAGSATKKFLVGYRHKDEIRSCLEAVSLVMRKEDWLKLPPKKFIDVPVKLGKEQRRIYEEMASNYIADLGNGETVEVDNPLSCLCKLTQIMNGFMYIGGKDPVVDLGLGESKKPPKKPEAPRVTVFLKDQPKLDALRDLLTRTLRGRKVVIWYNMSAEAILIENMLREVGIKYRTVKGGEKDTAGSINSFNNDPDITVLLCQAKAVNYGVTLLGSNLDDIEEAQPDLDTKVYTHVFYSLNYSLEVFIQQQDRSHRIGQTVSPEYYILKTDTDMEEAIVISLLNKERIREEFLVDITKRHRQLV